MDILITPSLLRGSVTVPAVLVPYMGGKTVLVPKR